MFEWTADMLARQLQWSNTRKQQELDDAREQLQRHGANLQNSTIAD